MDKIGCKKNVLQSIGTTFQNKMSPVLSLEQYLLIYF